MDVVSSPFTLRVCITSSSPLNSSVYFSLFLLDNESLLKSLMSFGCQLIFKNKSLKSWLKAVFAWAECVDGGLHRRENWLGPFTGEPPISVCMSVGLFFSNRFLPTFCPGGVNQLAYSRSQVWERVLGIHGFNTTTII